MHFQQVLRCELCGGCLRFRGKSLCLFLMWVCIPVHMCVSVHAKEGEGEREDPGLSGEKGISHIMLSLSLFCCFIP